jgi:hypothetical protein
MLPWNTVYVKRSKRTTRCCPTRRGKPIQNPTLCWVLQLFAGIHLLLIQGVQALVLNLNELHRQVLWLLGLPYDKLYS